MWAGGGCVCGVRGTAALMYVNPFRFLSRLVLARCAHPRLGALVQRFFFSFPDIFWYTFIQLSLLVPDQVPDHADHDADPA